MSQEKIKNFWENCSTTFAHITTDDWLKSKDNLFSLYYKKLKYFKINPNDKSITDYGIGGGYLGKYLLSNFNINKYIGIDIAERSIESAKKNLSSYRNVEFYLTPVNFKDLDSDLFISLAVIQHFPNLKYLNDFLSNLNVSNIEELLLQIRYSEENKFSKSYKTHADARLGCQTNSEYMLSRLTNYQLAGESSIEPETNYQYLYFKTKKQ